MEFALSLPEFKCTTLGKRSKHLSELCKVLWDREIIHNPNTSPQKKGRKVKLGRKVELAPGFWHTNGLL